MHQKSQETGNDPIIWQCANISVALTCLLLAPWNQFKLSSKIFYWPFQGSTSFVDLLCLFCLTFAMPLCASVYMCLVVTCWERADLLALVFWCLTVSLSLSHWYSWSGVILDCIDSWSLHPILTLSFNFASQYLPIYNFFLYNQPSNRNCLGQFSGIWPQIYMEDLLWSRDAHVT